jgi:hypothetical protein
MALSLGIKRFSGPFSELNLFLGTEMLKTLAVFLPEQLSVKAYLL